MSEAIIREEEEGHKYLALFKSALKERMSLQIVTSLSDICSTFEGIGIVPACFKLKAGTTLSLQCPKHLQAINK